MQAVTTTSLAVRQRRRSVRIAMLLVAGVLCVVIFPRLRSQRQKQVSWTTEPVVVGRFLKSVPGRGEVQTYRPTIVYNDCRNYEREILYLVPEGTWVEEGDLICELDCAELRDQLKKQQTELIRAQASLTNAEAQRELQNVHNARRQTTGRFELSQAQDKLRAFTEAEAILELERLRNDVSLKRQQTDAARELYEQARLFTALGFQSSNALATASSVFEGTARRRDQAGDLLHLTEQYLHPRSRLELTTQAELADRDVERIDLQCALTNSVTAVSVLEAQKWVAAVQRYVDYLTGAIDACTMYAPRAGELVYCHKRDEGRYIEVGSRVHYMQNLIRITDRSQLTVEGRVSDRQAHAVAEGQPVLITVPTMPNDMFHGTLNWIAPIPSEGAWYLPNDLHHKLQVLLTGDSPRLDVLALGASARLDIVVDDRPDVIQVVTDAVIPCGIGCPAEKASGRGRRRRPRGVGQRQRRQPGSSARGYAVIVKESEGLRVQPVELGVSNDETVEVLSGLTGEEQVVVDRREKLRALADSLPGEAVQRPPAP